MAPKMDPSSLWGASKGRKEKKSAGLSPIHTGSNKGLLQDCGKYVRKSYFGQNFEAVLQSVVWLKVGRREVAGRQSEDQDFR